MEQYINKSAVVAEIERKIEAHKETLKNCDSSISEMVLKGSMSAYQSLLHFFDTIEVKEVDLKLNKLYKQGWKDAVAKASIFVYQLATAFPDTSYTDADNMTDGFKKYMEEQL